MSELKICCFGVLTVRQAGEIAADLANSVAVRDLLGYLILHRGQTISRSQLAGSFWPNVPDAQARRNLNNLLWRLKQVANGRLAKSLTTSRKTIHWTLPKHSWLDLDQFEQGRQQFAETSPLSPLLDEGQQTRLEELIDLASSPLLADCTGKWCEPHRVRYQEQARQLQQLLINSYEAAGAFDEALHQAVQLRQTEPYLEWAHEAIMRLNIAIGRPQDALQAFRAYCRSWRDGLGLEPSMQIQQIMQTVTQQDDEHGNTNVLQLTLNQMNQLVEHQEIPKQLIDTIQASIQTIRSTMLEELQQIGNAAETLYQWQVAQHSYQLALTLLENLPQVESRLRERFELRLRCDTLYDRAADREKQRANLARAYQLAEALADPALQSEVCARNCWVACAEGRLETAVSHGNQALTLAGNVPHLRAQALRLLGSNYEMRGAYRLAAAKHREAVALDSHQPHWLRLDHNNLASVYVALGEDWLAWQQIEQAKKLLPTDDKPTLAAAIILANRSNIARNLGDFGTAAADLQAAQRQIDMLGDRNSAIMLATRAATLYRQTNDLPRARLWVDYAFVENRRLGDPFRAIEAMLEGCRLAFLRGEMQKARDDMETVIEQAAIAQLERYRGVGWLLYGAVLLPENVDAADEAARVGLTAVQQTEQKHLLLFAYSLLSLIAAQRDGEEAAQEYKTLAYSQLCQMVSTLPTASQRHRFLHATPLRRAIWEKTAVSLPQLLQFG